METFEKAGVVEVLGAKCVSFAAGSEVEKVLGEVTSALRRRWTRGESRDDVAASPSSFGGAPERGRASVWSYGVFAGTRTVRDMLAEVVILVEDSRTRSRRSFGSR